MRANYRTLKPYDIKENLCTCGDDPQKLDRQCDSNKVKVCDDPHYQISPLQTEECPANEKGTAPYSLHYAISDLHSSRKPSVSRSTVGIYPKVISKGLSQCRETIFLKATFRHSAVKVINI